MGKDLRLFLLAVALPALAVAGAGIYLIRCEVQREHERKEELRQELEAEEKEAQNQAERLGQQRMRAERKNHRWNRRRQYGAPQCMPHPHEAGTRFFPRLFSPEQSVATERILWIGGCMFALLLLSFGAGGWLLLRDARRAREEALKKTDFLSNISHEFKTPLTTICLCAELAQDDGLSPERRKKALGSICSEANRLKGLVLAALDFSRLEKNRRAFSLGPCDLRRLLKDVAEPLAPRFANGLVLPEGADEVAAVVDAGAFKQICVIILDNAAKYASAGGPVEVGFLSPRPGRVAMTVSDHGPGLDKDGIKHIFDRFWRGDNATTAETGGSGLGLAIARGLARGMGGALSVALRKGGGLVFTLEMKS
ncbi:MAG: HAMP domain-containing histidine kinase [Kiritimatiellae bacterium]|nr:HAMP domain-containing histidine kinase [Kiritimatiellia bacterium]